MCKEIHLASLIVGLYLVWKEEEQRQLICKLFHLLIGYRYYGKRERKQCVVFSKGDLR